MWPVKAGNEGRHDGGVSAGLYAWSADDVARIAVNTVRDADELDHLDLVRFVLFNAALHGAFLAACS